MQASLAQVLKIARQDKVRGVLMYNTWDKPGVID